DEHERALLIRITVNCTNTLFTGAFRRHTVALDESLAAAADASRHDTVDAVMTLPQKYRTVIHLHYFEGYSVEEIATLLNSKPSTVKSWLHRGREKLRGLLEGVD
ncbi:MAG: RNA polymerase sigma factor, partial [Clostridia bacterium]|nr:RNA polymerase sigma factor [Clostridia bacterium]